VSFQSAVPVYRQREFCLKIRTGPVHGSFIAGVSLAERLGTPIPPGRQFQIFGVDFLLYPVLWLALVPVWLVYTVVQRISGPRT
jgi:hypothetical protein